MPRTQKLLLVENVESLGIVGDIVNVRNGYARNFLLPRALATKPSDELIQQLQGKRAEAQKMLAEQRRLREGLSQKLQGVEVKLIRSCNDQGILYAAITQQDVANELNAGGYAVKPRDVRINQVMKRVHAHFAPFGDNAFRSYWFEMWVHYEKKAGPAHTWERDTTGRVFTAANMNKK